MAETPIIGESRLEHDPAMRRAAYRLLGFLARAVMVIAVAATFVVSTALLVYGAFETWHLVDALLSDTGPERDNVMLAAIEIVDIFLVATVIQVVSIGLYQLYINRSVPLPEWLRIDDIDDLKAKLTGVVITVLGVFFLGAAIASLGSDSILPLGGAVAAVIVALTYFLSTLKAH